MIRHVRSHRWAAALAIACVASAAGAQVADCRQPVTQSDLNACADGDFRKADAALNAVYGSVVKEPSLAARLDRLRAAERAWVDFRTAQCAFEGSEVEGGSAQPMVIQGCAKALTDRRTAELRAMLACARDSARC